MMLFTKHGCIVKNRRKRSGGAMLELALLIPLYMLVFFIVWTMGDLGLVSSQAHLASRFAAWKRTPASPDTVYKAVGGGVLRAQPVTGPAPSAVGYAHRLDSNAFIPMTDMRYWEQSSEGEAYSFATYSLPSPLKQSEKADTTEADTTETAEYEYPQEMLALAMEGDSSSNEHIPWLTRKVAKTSLSMRGAAGITSRRAITSVHTVLLGAQYFTLVPLYYSKKGGEANLSNEDRVQCYLCLNPDQCKPQDTERHLLRNPRAIAPNNQNKEATKGGRLHQLHFMSGRTALKPEF